jgi:hypothetical protein
MCRTLGNGKYKFNKMAPQRVDNLRLPQCGRNTMTACWLTSLFAATKRIFGRNARLTDRFSVGSQQQCG